MSGQSKPSRKPLRILGAKEHLAAQSPEWRQWLEEWTEELRRAGYMDSDQGDSDGRLGGVRPMVVGVVEQSPAGGSSRRPGRPAWTFGVFAGRLADAFQDTAEPWTLSRLAEHFVTLNGETGIEPDSLARLIRRFNRE